MENSSRSLLLHNVVLLARGSTEKGVAQQPLQADSWAQGTQVNAWMAHPLYDFEAGQVFPLFCISHAVVFVSFQLVRKHGQGEGHSL